MAPTRLGKRPANAKGQFARPAPWLTLSCAAAKTAGMSWRIYREPGWLAGAALILSLMAPSPFAGAADATRAELAARYPELHAAIYDMTVCEYCGLITPEVAGGFRRRVTELVARDALSDRTVREIRIIAWTRADLEWSNRGLGGFRAWCATEGEGAARRFVGYGAGQRRPE